MKERGRAYHELRRRRRSGRVKELLLGLLLVTALVTGGAFYRLLRPFVTPGTGIQNQVREVYQATMNPRDAFPGKDRLYVLVLGIDANYTRQGIMYTKNARSDTILVASLDLDTKRVGILSIPRDTRVELAYGRGRDKINAAHAYGGIPLAKATVEQFLGIDIDHYVVIKMHGTRNFVDAIGGVTLDVEKDMDYDDNWGHLHIHLKKGRQHLNGEQAMGYARFRHDDEGDFGRMRRQQQLVRAIAQQLLTPKSLLRLDQIVDAAMENIITDLSRAQLLALANLFRTIRSDQIHTGTLAGYGSYDHGVWYVDPSETKKEALVGWLLRGEEWYRNGLISIRVHNASGLNGAGTLVRDILRDQGFDAYLGKSVRGAANSETRVVDLTGQKDAAQQIARLFPEARLESASEAERPEAGGPDILVYVGRESARALAGQL